MNRAIEHYLEQYGASDFVREKAETAIEAFKFLSGEEPDVLFICDPADDETSLPFSSIWGFREELWLRAQLEGDVWDVDISSYKEAVYYLSIQFENLELPDTVNEHSQLSVEIQTDKLAYSSLSARGENCKTLLEIVEKRFCPNVRKLPAGVKK